MIEIFFMNIHFNIFIWHDRNVYLDVFFISVASGEIYYFDISFIALFY